MKMAPYMEVVTPMSRTRPARELKTEVSATGSPNSLTRRAPETLKRSVMVLFISALSE